MKRHYLYSVALTASLIVGSVVTPVYAGDEKLCAEGSCAKQISKLKRHARYGNPEAIVLLASAYINGEGVEKNPELAIKKLKRAAREDFGKAMFMLSALYKDGIGTEVNIEKSNNWLEKAVKNGYAPALYQKALKTLDFNKADNSDELELLLSAEKKGNKAATYLMARLRESGTLVEKDEVKAAESFRNLSFWNYSDSKARLASIAERAQAAAIESEDTQQIAALAEDIETITVTGKKLSFEMALDNTITRITRDSIYDGRSTGSYIPGRGCTKRNGCSTISDPNDLSMMGMINASSGTNAALSSASSSN